LIETHAINDVDNFDESAIEVWKNPSLSVLLFKDLINKEKDVFDTKEIVKDSYIVLWFSAASSLIHH